MNASKILIVEEIKLCISNPKKTVSYLTKKYNQPLRMLLRIDIFGSYAGKYYY